MADTPEVSPELVKKFNEAAALAREGKSEEAVAAWDRLLDPPAEGAPGDFLGLAQLRKAWALMDLERYAEALAIFEGEALTSLLAHFDPDALFWYFFSYGNTLGSLGRIEEMDEQLTRALGLAGRELDDVQRCQMCWQNMMLFAEEHEAWEYLEQEASNGLGFADQNDLQVFGFLSGLHRVAALRGLERLDEAREQARELLARAKEWEADDAVERVEALLEELG